MTVAALLCIVELTLGGGKERAPAALTAEEANGPPPFSQAEEVYSIASALPHTERGAQQLHVLEVRALVTQGKLAAAKERAAAYFARWPHGPDTQALEELTGAHPEPSRSSSGAARDAAPSP